jgi:hypothetical protein
VGDPDVLSPEEFAGVCRALSDAEWTKLRSSSKTYAFGNVVDSRDLLHEAIARTLSGERRCPRPIGIMVYLLLTMRSIASDEQQDWNREHGPPPVRRITKDGDVTTREVEYESNELL